ncbi:unnamed protein product [Toxocara canis]|uniref:Uncharacterized protein n=1 Tax=Toxocara canis TaxID=6265 RepID=A0A183US46_TOXCA|nr:unnamed protein product [Toxocara canis]
MHSYAMLHIPERALVSSGRDEDNRRRRRSSMEIKEQHLMSIRHQAHMPNRYCRVGGGGGGTYGNCKWFRGVVSHRGSYRYGEHSAWNRAGQRSNYNYKQFQGGFQQRRFRNCARWNKNNDAAILRQDAFASYNTSSLPRPASPSFHSHFSSSPPPSELLTHALVRRQVFDDG